MNSNKLGDVIKRFNLTMQQATELLADQSSLGTFLPDLNFVLNRKQYNVIRKAAEDNAFAQRFSKQPMVNSSSILVQRIPISKLSFQENKITYTFNDIKYQLKLNGISKRIELKKDDISEPFLHVKVKLNTRTKELMLNRKVCVFLCDYSQQVLKREVELERLLRRNTDNQAIPLNQFTFNDGFMQVNWNGRKYTYWDNRIRASHMNLIKGTIHGKKKHRRKHGIAPIGTTLTPTFLLKSGTMLFENLDVYEFLESLYPQSRSEKHPFEKTGNDFSTSLCTIESIHFDTNKYTVVFRNKNRVLDPFEEQEKGCTPVLNIVCNYLKNKIPTDILVEHKGDNVKRIITKFKIQDFISFLISKKYDHDADYWGIVKNEEKRTFSQIRNISKTCSNQIALRMNEYVDILASFQSPEKILLLSYEVSNSQNEEDAFIFSHQYNDKWIVIMENVNSNRATEVFVTLENDYDDCVYSIFDYFTNYDLEHKRINFKNKKIDKRKFYSIEYHTIDHKNISSWINKLNSIHMLIPQAKEPFVFTGGLRLGNNNFIRNTKEQTTTVSHLHDIMMKKLYDLKVEEFGEDNVETEVPVGQKRIDLVVKKGELYDFYEIKTYEDPGKCVQEAFGQILLYAKMSYWDKIDNLYIIGPSEIDHSDNWMIKNDSYEKSLSLKYLSLPWQ